MTIGNTDFKKMTRDVLISTAAIVLLNHEKIASSGSSALLTGTLAVCIPFIDRDKPRLIASVISGSLISEQYLPSSSDPALKLLKTAGVTASIYYALKTSTKILGSHPNLEQGRPR